MNASEELTTYALVVGSVRDAVATDGTLRSPVTISALGIGTPPVSNDGIWARAWAPDGFVIVADAGVIPLEHPASSDPSPKHLAGAFDVHFVLSADGYADLAATVSCSHDAVPLRPPAYALAPNPVAIAGRVVVSGIPPTPLAGATVSITAMTPPATLPAAVTTDADGMYVFVSVPAAQSITLAASGGGHSGSATVAPAYPQPLLTVNFALT